MLFRIAVIALVGILGGCALPPFKVDSALQGSREQQIGEQLRSDYHPLLGIYKVTGSGGGHSLASLKAPDGDLRVAVTRRAGTLAIVTVSDLDRNDLGSGPSMKVFRDATLWVFDAEAVKGEYRGYWTGMVTNKREPAALRVDGNVLTIHSGRKDAEPGVSNRCGATVICSIGAFTHRLERLPASAMKTN